MTDADPSATYSPLQGIRVADLTTVLMGPLATRMLADLGADVIRVEEPGGDIVRSYDPMRSDLMGAFSINLNRNKRSIALDLKSGPGMEAMRDLIATSDVFVTNLRRKALDRLGLDEASVRAIRPDIVYCVANGFGSTGPNADHAAYDDVIQAASGLAAMFSWVGDSPRLIPSVIADKISGLHVAHAILAALYGRQRDGEGVSIEVPMGEVMAAFNLIEHLGSQTFEPPFGAFTHVRVTTPHRRPRRTSDGWIVILPYSQDNWDRFWDFSGHPEVGNDPRFATARDRMNHTDALYELMDVGMASHTSAEWLAFCQEHSIPASEVMALENVRDDPHFDAVGLLVEAEHPTEGAYRYVRDPITYNGEFGKLRRHAPRLGADGAEVLRELGWDDDRIRDALG